MGLIGYRSYDAAVHWNPLLCMFSLLAALLIAVRRRPACQPAERETTGEPSECFSACRPSLKKVGKGCQTT